MMLFNNFLTSRLILNARSSRAFQQFYRPLQSLTPIFNHHNFHPKCNAVRSTHQTGLLQNFTSILSSNNYQEQYQLRKFIHGQRAALCSKQKDEKNKIDDDDENKNKKINIVDDAPSIDDKQLGLIARFKKMTKEYWYVLIPVHCFTSCFWFGGFYYTSVWYV